MMTLKTAFQKGRVPIFYLIILKAKEIPSKIKRAASHWKFLWRIVWKVSEESDFLRN